MLQPLPIGGFKWVESIDVMTIPEDSMTGYIYEVDIHIPVEFHDRFRDLPPCPDHMEIKNDFRSPFLDCDITPSRKLAPNLYDKERYVVYYKTLQLYLRLGIRVTKIHRILSFDQRPWLRDYVLYNTTQRAAADNDFDKERYKLAVNRYILTRKLSLYQHTN
jgi:hypothetical protein